MRKIIVLILAAVFFILIAYWGGVYWTYAWLTQQIREFTGLDLPVSRLLAIAAVAAVSAVPWSALIFSFVSAKRKRFAWLTLTVVTTLWSLGLSFLRQGVNFSPDGAAQKAFVITPYGPVIRNTSDFGVDSETGRRREPLTSEHLREIDLFKKHAGDPLIEGPARHNFNRVTGESEAWILLQPAGCTTSAIPAYDETTGHPFQQATPELVDECQKREVQAQRKEAQNAENKEQEQEQQGKHAKRARFEEPGVYSGNAHFWTSQGLRFAIREANILRDFALIPIEISSFTRVGPQEDSSEATGFTIIREDGVEKACSVEKYDDHLNNNSQDETVAPPNEMASSILLRCQRANDSGRFTVALNHRPVFRITRYGWRFRPF